MLPTPVVGARKGWVPLCMITARHLINLALCVGFMCGGGRRIGHEETTTVERKETTTGG
jgi:hypothetical protein